MSDATYASTDLRKALMEKYRLGEPGGNPYALSAPTRAALDLLVNYVIGYNTEDPELEDDILDDEYFNILLSRVESQSSWEHARTGNVSGMRAISGSMWDDNRVSATGYELLVDDLRPAAQQWIVKGPKGSGKTVKVSDVAQKSLENGVVDKVMSNILWKGCDPEFPDIEFPEGHDVRFSEDISAMLMFAMEPGDKLLIIDEASTVLNMLSGGGDAQKIFSKIINALRKSVGGSTRLIIVGHRHDTDILPTLRNNTDCVLYAEGKKEEGLIDKASMYDGWTAFKEDDAKYKLQGLQNIPDGSPWAVDTNYFAHVNLDLDNPDEQIQRGRLIDNWEDYQESDSEGGVPPVDVDEAVLRSREDEYLRMHEDGELSYSDISDATGTPKSTVGDMVARARDRQESSEMVE